MKGRVVPTIRRGFTLLELMAVVLLIAILLGAAALTFANARPSVKVKKDAGQMVAFLRNMWDLTRASGSPLVLLPDFENGSLSYTDPRTGKTFRARFSSDAHIMAIRLNERYYSALSQGNPSAAEDPLFAPDQSALYISEGRGLTRIAVLFGIPREGEGYRHVTLCALNLVTGKGGTKTLDETEVDALMGLLGEVFHEG